MDDEQWVHLDDAMRPASPYVQKCYECGWKGSTPNHLRNCPDCGSPSLMTDHKAQK